MCRSRADRIGSPRAVRTSRPESLAERRGDTDPDVAPWAARGTTTSLRDGGCRSIRTTYASDEAAESAMLAEQRAR